MLNPYIGAFLLVSFFFGGPFISNIVPYDDLCSLTFPARLASIGAFTVLIMFSTYTILASGFYSSGTIFKALVTLTMYAIGAAHFGTSLAKFAVGDSVSYTTFLVLENSLMFLTVINYIISDAVVVWRCWLLWGRRWSVLAVPILLFVFTLVAAIFIMVFDVEALSFLPRHSDRDRIINNISIRDKIVWSLTLATNVWSTSLVTYKAWKLREDVKAHLQTSDVKSQVEILMALLVESGTIYCFIWLVFIITGALSDMGSFVLNGVMPQIAGIYPTIIIVLVSFGKTRFQNFTRDREHDNSDVVFTAYGGTSSPTGDTGIDVIDLRAPLVDHNSSVERKVFGNLRMDSDEKGVRERRTSL